METTFELPVLQAKRPDPLHAYEKHFGALPGWLDEIGAGAARSLASQSLRRGVPLSPADDFYR